MKLILSLFQFALLAVGALIAGAFLSVIIEWLGMWLGWWSSPNHAREVLMKELRWAGLLNFWLDPLPALQAYGQAADNFVLRWTATGTLAEYILAAVYALQLVLLRIFVVVTSLPAIAVLWTLCILDGLLARDIRKFTSARESGFVYHNSKALLNTMICLPASMYVASPVGFHPSLFMAVAAGPSGLLLWSTAANFKKYL